MSQTVFGAEAVVSILNRAFTNTSPGKAIFNNQVTFAGTTRESQLAFAAQFGNGFASLVNNAEALTDKLITNMGLSGLNADFLAALRAEVIAIFETVAPEIRGIVVLLLSEKLSSLEGATGDLAFASDVAAAWNNEISKSFEFSLTSPVAGDPLADTTAPVIAAQTFSYAENQAADAVVAQVVATDNSGTVASFAIKSGNADNYFAIDPATGKISITAAGVAAGVNNFEAGVNSTALVVEAKDAAGNAKEATITLNETNVGEFATGAAAGTTVKLNFDAALKAGITVPTGDFTVTQGSSSFTVVQTNVAGTTVTLTLATPVAATGNVSVNYTGTALVDANNVAVVQQVMTAVPGDITAPTATIAPVDGATAVATNANIVLTFDEAVVKGAGNITLTNAVDATQKVTVDVASAEVSISADGKTVTINPTADLAGNVKYNVAIPAGSFKDAAGNNYAGSVDYDFTTAAAVVTTPGQTFTLTQNIDNIAGTSGNDTIIADNSGTLKTATAGDQVDGGSGTDTIKYYADATAGFHAQVLPQISNVEVLYMKGGIADDDQTLDVTTIAGLTSVELDTPAAALDIAAAKNFTVKTTASQTVALSNFNAATGKLGKIALTNATNLTVNNVGADTTNDGVVSIDVANTTATSATITTATAASKVTLLNGSAKLATLNVAGDKNLTLTEDLATLKTINASTATGNVSVVAAGTAGLNGVDAKLDAAFAFTGGAGNDTLKLTQGSLQALTAGSQLDAGAGSKDTLFVIANNKAAADLAFVSADYKAINATKGFEKLAIEAGAIKDATVDASLLTSIKHFGVSAVTNTISKVGAGSTLDIDAATTLTTVTGAVGVKDLTINIGSDTATAATANAALDITGLTDVTINANIKAGVTGQTHKVGTLTYSDNSTFTIKGNGDFEIALGAATVTGSKVDGSASTGKLTITGGTTNFDPAKASLSDVLIGGSGDDVIKASENGGSLTGNGGKDVFDVTAAATIAAGTPITLITDFTKGDGIKFQGSAAIVEKIDLSGLAAGKTDLEVITAIASAATTAVNDIAWGTYNGNTYVFNQVATAGAIDATDIAVKLTGVLDLSTSTLNITTDILTFA